jgi:hypothetical protein
MPGEGRSHISRAQRFPIHIPLRYRMSGMPDWREARTLNISRTGILIRADEAPQAESALDIRLRFPLNVNVSCHGSVVRSEETAFAVKIHRYRHHRACP